MKYIIHDWASNIMFNGIEFNSFEDGWEYVFENIEDEEEYQDIYVVEKES